MEQLFSTHMVQYQQDWQYECLAFVKTDAASLTNLAGMLSEPVPLEEFHLQSF